MSFRYCSAAGSASSFARVPAGGSAVIDNTSGDHCLIAPYITVWSGITCNNVVFRPMLRLEGTSDTYEAPLGKNTYKLIIDETLTEGQSVSVSDKGLIISVFADSLNTLTVDTTVRSEVMFTYK